MTTEEELTDLERRGWEALTTLDAAAFYDGIMTGSCLMFFPQTGVLSRDEVIEGMESATPWSWFKMHDVHVEETAHDGEPLAIVSYRVEAQRPGDPVYRAHLASTYRREEGRWLLAFHEHSPLPSALPEGEEPR